MKNIQNICVVGIVSKLQIYSRVKMKKVVKSLIGVTTLALLMSSEPLSNPVSASSSKEAVGTMAVSRYVEVTRIVSGVPLSTISYSDAYGYKGTLTLLREYPYPGGKIQAVYGGTVHCSGKCAAQ
ncbi:hypothetical protein V1498_10505 [Peribacillus sp. SCS-26]|uniref:hypothetical protein n=1 Tax=Paraperibacillus marinus TaxID=3115295 RepID=UPI0039063D96